MKNSIYRSPDPFLVILVELILPKGDINIVRDEAWQGMKSAVSDVLKALTKTMPDWKSEDKTTTEEKEN